ncbi:MAG: PIN domain-containing protein [Pirellulales bacterium]|nr:PIN domain-containing protein [Pirellulales bacterium]
MTYLPDVNVWLALAFRQHRHHAAANAWFEGVEEGASLCICRMTQQGFLRLATHPKVVGSEAVRLPDAWRLYDRIFEDPRVHFGVEPPGIDERWRGLTQSPQFSPHVWNDAYLAAFAACAGFEIVTFDRGFEQFTLQRCTILA